MPELDADATVAEPASAAARQRRASRTPPPTDLHARATVPPGASGVGSRGTVASSPAEAMREDEILRTRVFLKLALGLVAAALLAVAFAEADAVVKVVVLGGGLSIACAAAWMLWVTRNPAGYTTRRIIVVAVAGAIGASTSLVFWGVASPAAAIILFGIYFFSLGTQPVVTAVLYVLCAVAHATLSALIMADVLVDRGLVPLDTLSWRNQLATTLVVQVLFAVAFATGRASRRATLATVSRLDRAVRGIAQREAALVEARANLDRALKLGGPGRFTAQVVGSFRLGVLLGRGGMGEVYEAVHVGDGSPAAVKLLPPGALAEAHHVRRFVREAELAAKLVSPFIVAVREVGTTDGELPYLAMERLHGQDLAQLLRKHRTGAPSMVVELVREVAQGLEVARAAGVVHRDLKPHNLFRAERDGRRRWTILDFGVSTTIGGHGTLTGGQVIGTPQYMAPEQARGGAVDHRADVYALAAIAYRALCGQPPHAGAELAAIIHEVVYASPRRPTELATLPVDVDDRALALGLAKDPADRCATALEFAEVLAAACAGALPPALRRRADLLTARAPWGKRAA